MIGFVGEFAGAEPIAQTDGSYTPFSLALKLAVPSKTSYDHANYEDAYAGADKKVLVISTEERFRITGNGEHSYDFPFADLTIPGFQMAATRFYPVSDISPEKYLGRSGCHAIAGGVVGEMISIRSRGGTLAI